MPELNAGSKKFELTQRGLLQAKWHVLQRLARERGVSFYPDLDGPTLEDIEVELLDLISSQLESMLHIPPVRK